VVGLRTTGFSLPTGTGAVKTALIALLISIAATSAAHARTWRVEKDGSGDYTVIQDAVDAAAPGDTIAIGAGRFTEYALYSINGYYDANVYVFVTVEDLTLIGEGTESTIIGPGSPHSEPPYGPIGILGLQEAASIRLIGLAVEHIEYGVYQFYGSLIVQQCRIANCPNIGLELSTDGGATIEDCIFVDNEFGGLISYNPARNIYISRCQFSNNPISASFNGTNNVRIDDCTFENGSSGIEFQEQTTGEAYRNTLEYLRTAIVSSSGSTSYLESNVIVNCEEGMWVRRSHLSGRNNIVNGGWFSAITLSNGDIDFEGNHILNGGAYSIRLDGYPGIYPPDPVQLLNLRNNYWGTTEAAQIDEWILDKYDDPNINAYVVYEPFADGPIPTETKSWSDVKALYR
jgi:hypothetical protein